jgi:hypothetical protein
MINRGLSLIVAFVLVASFVMAAPTGKGTGGTTDNGIIAPEAFFGFRPGADGKLAHHNKIRDYFMHIAEKSPRVNADVLGKTTLKNDMVQAVISSPENLAKLDRFKEISRRLSLGEVDKKEAEAMAAEGKAIVYITCNLHSTEIGSNQMAPLMLYHMATDNSEETKKILDNVIFVFVPSVNPDGQIMVVDWYNKYKGTRYDGTWLPYLYHWYAGHDNNRDWFKMNLKETRLISHEMYHVWYPQAMVDEHQMGSSGDRFFIPPFADPPTPGLHPLMWRTVNLIGTRIAFDLERRGYAGIGSQGQFMGWWIGALDDCAWFHNIPGILFETASVRTATPIYIEPEEVVSPVSLLNEERMFSPNPWKGGWWRLQDIVDYDFHATLSVLSTMATHPRQMLLNSYKMARDAINKGKTEAPYAYVVPKSQMDPMTAQKFIKTLMLSNIKVYRLKSPVTSKVGNHYFEAGSYVVPLAQPYRPFVKNIFERQHYPDIRRNPNDSRILPYDGSGWTLHLGMGVTANAILHPFKADMEPVTPETIYKQEFPSAIEDYILLEPRYNNSFLAASVLLNKGIDVWRNFKDPSVPKGTFIVKQAAANETLKEINKTMPLTLMSKPNLPLEKYTKLNAFKVGLFQDWGHNMEEGWTRYVFDEFKIDYDTLHAKDFQKKNALKNYDVLMFIGAPKSVMEKGKPPKEWERWTSPLPSEYSGGLEEKGKAALKEFLKAGKTLVFMTASCNYAVEHFRLPVSNVAENNRALNCPGSYLQAEVKDSELTFGLHGSAAIFYNGDPAFQTSLPRDPSMKRRTALVFGQRDLLLSGALEGESSIARKSLVVDFSIDGGRIVLIGPNLLFRAQTEGTYKIVFNTLFTAAK